MPGRLQNRIAIVTGSSSGIGRATSLAFAAEGATVVCADIREQPLQEDHTAFNKSPTASDDHLATHELIAKNGGRAIYQNCDVGRAADVEALVDRAVKEFGRLDIMFNNAGVALEAAGAKPIWDMDENVWDVTLKLNAKGVMLGCKYAARQMIKQEPLPGGDRGWIVNAASIYGLVGSAMPAAYVASKHACAGLTKAVALQLAPYRVHCNAICPGFVTTAMTDGLWADQTTTGLLTQLHPFRGLGRPEDISKAVVFLASEDNTWMTGAMMTVDGGYTAQ